LKGVRLMERVDDKYLIGVQGETKDISGQVVDLPEVYRAQLGTGIREEL